MRLHHDTLAARPSPTKSIAFLHGILGTGINLRSLARRFVEHAPEHLALLVDLRAHGRSQGTQGEDTVAAASADVAETALALGLPLTAAVGHSFGGKVALGLLGLVPGLERVVTLDSAPGARLDARGSEEAVRVLRLLEALHGPWRSREAFVAELEGRGERRAIAGWLAMNLVAEEGQGLRLQLTLPRIHALLDSYLALDAWPAVEAAVAQGRPRVDLVIASGSEVYRPEDVARANRLAQGSRGQLGVHVLDGGHWLHVDNPDAVERVLRGSPP